MYIGIVSYSIMFDPSSNGMFFLRCFSPVRLLEIYFGFRRMFFCCSDCLGWPFSFQSPCVESCIISDANPYGSPTHIWASHLEDHPRTCKYTTEVSKSPRPGVVGPNGLNNGL